MGSRNVHNVYVNKNMSMNENMHIENVKVNDNSSSDIRHEVFRYFINMHILDKLDVVLMSVTGGGNNFVNLSNSYAVYSRGNT